MTEASRIRLLDLPALHAPIRDAIDAAIARVLDDGRFVLGEEVEAFERDLAAYTGAAAAVSCASGSDALLLALMACGVGPGDEVLCPAYSFFATASAVTRLGATPVFADIDPASYALDPGQARATAAGCRRLRAILPVDLYGRSCDLDAFLALGEALGVPVIEDAAQALGARDASGAMAGSRTDFGCFSLYPSKNLGALGDGGIVTLRDGDLAQRIARLRSHGETASYVHDEVGINSRLDALQAAVLRVKLPQLEAWTKARRENAAFYERVFAEAGAGISGDALAGAALPLLTPAVPAPPARHVHHQYVVRVPATLRDGLRAHLATRGIETAVYYPRGLHEQPSLRARAREVGPLPHTEAAARESLALPVHATLRPAQRERVAEEVVRWLSVRCGG